MCKRVILLGEVKQRRPSDIEIVLVHCLIVIIGDYITFCDYSNITIILWGTWLAPSQMKDANIKPWLQPYLGFILIFSLGKLVD